MRLHRYLKGMVAGMFLVVQLPFVAPFLIKALLSKPPRTPEEAERFFGRKPE